MVSSSSEASPQKSLARAVLSNAHLTNSTVTHHGQLGDLEELQFTPKKSSSQKILCWVLTMPSTHDTKAKAVARTWGPWCDTLLFMTTAEDPNLPVVKLTLEEEESRKLLWHKTRSAWLYLYEHHIGDHDWFIKADDDTYVAVQNLREYLRKLDPNDAYFLGREFVYERGTPEELHYHSGGAGYVLSRESLKRLGEDPSKLEATTTEFEKYEDVEMARSMLNAGVKPTDVLGEDGLEAFLPFEIEYHRIIRRQPNDDWWYWRYSANPPKEGEECCSRKWMTSHYLDEVKMYLYHARVLAGKEAGGKLPSELQMRS